jgi:hypothetical protein
VPDWGKAEQPFPLDRLERLLQVSGAIHGFGVRCDDIQAIDIDVDDPAKVHKLVEALVGMAKMICPQQSFAIRRRVLTKYGVFLGEKAPVRLALLYRAHPSNKPMMKQVFYDRDPEDSGKVEFLGNRQFIALAAGQWNKTYECCTTEYQVEWPEKDLLELSTEEIGYLKVQVQLLYPDATKTREAYLSTSKRLAGGSLTAEGERLKRFLLEKGLSRGLKDAFSMYVDCPWEHNHTTPKQVGEAIVFFQRTGEPMAYHCLHSHCQDKKIGDYLLKIGYTAEEFEVPGMPEPPPLQLSLPGTETEVPFSQEYGMLESKLSDEELIAFRETGASDEAIKMAVHLAERMATRMVAAEFTYEQTAGIGPKDGDSNINEEEEIKKIDGIEQAWRVDNKGRIQTSKLDVVNMLMVPAATGIEIAYDEFSKAILLRDYKKGATWKEFTDNDYTRVQFVLSSMVKQVLDIPTPAMREVIEYVAIENTFNSAQRWLKSLRWDGKDRIDDFITKGLSATPTWEMRECVKYLFSAMAGRIIRPGVKADIAPIFLSRKGTGKSTFVRNLAPFNEWAGQLSFETNEANRARITAGKVLIEIPELAGLKTRANESIKAWLSSQEDTWIPKFKEMKTTAPRTWLLIGTGNERSIFSDATGNRRWLPMEVARNGQRLGIDWLIANRDQIWAQGRAIFETFGIQYQEAERIADKLTDSYRDPDAWEQPALEYITRKIVETGEMPTPADVFQQGLGLAPAQITWNANKRLEAIIIARAFHIQELLSAMVKGLVKSGEPIPQEYDLAHRARTELALRIQQHIAG